MKHIVEFPRQIKVHEDIGIIMRDGCRLSARLWLPVDADDDPVPVILEHLPYRKRDGTIARDEFNHPWMAGHGYAVLRTDMRGNGDSEGLMEDEYTPQELQDACDVIAWATSQEWCNGNAGMMGISWGGFNCLQVAALQPPALKAVISVCSTVDRYADDIHYKGGCLLTSNFGWAANMLAYSSRPPDPLLVGDDKWLAVWRNRLEHMPFNLKEWLGHQHRDDYWKHGSICEDYSAVKAAVLSMGGWHDGYRNTISHLVENIEAPVKGIVGPWNHKYANYGKPGPSIGFLQEAKRWWDRWLKGMDTGVETDPDYRVWLMDSLEPKRWFDERPGRWIAEPQWPSESVEHRVFGLASDNRLVAGEVGEGSSPPLGLCVSSPQDCGLMSGEYFPFAFSDELPDRQNHDDERSVCFDSDVLDTALDIVGAPRIRLALSSSEPNGLVAVRLCDVFPDGTSAHITSGYLNLTHYKSHEYPEPLVPGVEFEISLVLDQIAYRIPAGHRLRIAVSNAHWPFVWPSPAIGMITLASGRMELPVRPLAEGDECGFGEPEGSPLWDITVVRKPSYQRRLEEEEVTGAKIVRVISDAGAQVDNKHGLLSDGRNENIWTIHPDVPLSANGRSTWYMAGGREGQMWKTHVVAEMTCDADNFHYDAKLVCHLNDEIFFEKVFAETIPRQLV